MGHYVSRCSVRQVCSTGTDHTLRVRRFTDDIIANSHMFWQREGTFWSWKLRNVSCQALREVAEQQEREVKVTVRGRTPASPPPKKTRWRQLAKHMTSYLGGAEHAARVSFTERKDQTATNPQRPQAVNTCRMWCGGRSTQISYTSKSTWVWLTYQCLFFSLSYHCDQSYSSKSKDIMLKYYFCRVKYIHTNHTGVKVLKLLVLKVSKVQVKVNKTHIFTCMLWVDQDDHRVRYSAFFHN